MTDKQLLDLIQAKIPEFDSEKNDGSWVWTYRCFEAEEGSDTLIESFINFTATILKADDEAMELNDDDEPEPSNRWFEEMRKSIANDW